jgi:hypothetical protein
MVLADSAHVVTDRLTVKPALGKHFGGNIPSWSEMCPSRTSQTCEVGTIFIIGPGELTTSHDESGG